jgi:hypothetical protein
MDGRAGLLRRRRILLLCAGFALMTAVVPFARAFFLFELSYNEGWNVYNANVVVNHQLLYPVAYGWTTVNYPVLSFFVLAGLHRLTHEYLFTARVLSLLSVVGCCALVSAIVRRLGAAWPPSVLAGFFCLALFCSNAGGYVGMDDPQMFAQVFFLAGLLVYLWNRRSFRAIGCAALLFVTGGCIKHNLIDFPLAVLIDLCFVSRLRAVWFVLCGVFLAGIAVVLNVHYGGPYFLSQLLAPREYGVGKSFEMLGVVLGPVLLPLGVAVFMAIKVRRDPVLRIAAILLGTTVVIGWYFSGGHGVAINGLFSSLLAIAILVGLFFERSDFSGWMWRGRCIATWAPPILFAWLTIPLIISGDVNPVGALGAAASAQRRFAGEVKTLRGLPGPALCESLLRCYFAGKPYLYDPFNATRLIRFGKLDAGVLVDGIRRGQYGAIQLDGQMTDEADLERFDPAVLAAIQQYYFVAAHDEDVAIYVPKRGER